VLRTYASLKHRPSGVGTPDTGQIVFTGIGVSKRFAADASTPTSAFAASLRLRRKTLNVVQGSSRRSVRTTPLSISTSLGPVIAEIRPTDVRVPIVPTSFAAP
jgi:hypothetical protein